MQPPTDTTGAARIPDGKIEKRFGLEATRRDDFVEMFGVLESMKFSFVGRIRLIDFRYFTRKDNLRQLGEACRMDQHRSHSGRETHLLEVPTADREAFVLCLALGTLEAMRSGVWPLEAGIWTLGRPAFLKSLRQAEIDPAVIAELQDIDELPALAKLGGRPAADARLDSMIAAVRSRLAALDDPAWQARWSQK